MRRLNTIREDIYSLDGFCDYTVVELAIAVHPFFDKSAPKEYFKSFAAFLKGFKGPC